MRDLDWEYMTEILEAATEGGTGCAPELFDGGKAWYALGKQLPPGWGEESLSAEEQEKELETLIEFHTHTGVLADMGLIEIWDNQAMRNAWRFWHAATVHQLEQRGGGVASPLSTLLRS